MGFGGRTTAESTGRWCSPVTFATHFWIRSTLIDCGPQSGMTAYGSLAMVAITGIAADEVNLLSFADTCSGSIGCLLAPQSNGSSSPRVATAPTAEISSLRSSGQI